MIGSLQGKVCDKTPNSLIVNCTGVGYLVFASNLTLAHVGEEGAEANLSIFTHFNDSKISLFGFATKEEKALFDLLITVKNVGPMSALRLLSAAESSGEVAHWIASGNSKALQKMKGVGKKTAELLVVELREKCETLLIDWKARGVDVSDSQLGFLKRGATGDVGSGTVTRIPILSDVAEALVQMGWKPAEADKAVDGLTMPPPGTESIEGLLKQALRGLSR